jgi:alpha-L-fucosidase
MKIMGDWLKKNGESIYGTDKSPFVYLPFGRATQKGNKIYLHIFNRPTDGKIKIPMANKLVRSYLLSDSTIKITSTKDEKFTYVQLPILKDSIASVVALEVEGAVVSTIKQPVPSLKANIIATSDDGKNKSKNAVDGNPSSFWKAQTGKTKDTLTVEFGAEYTVSAVSFIENNENIRQFVLEYQDGNEWKMILEGKKMGKQLLPFTSLKARYVRLIIKESSKEPSIKEMQFFADE